MTDHIAISARVRYCFDLTRAVKGDIDHEQGAPSGCARLVLWWLDRGCSAARTYIGMRAQVTDLYDPREQWASYLINALKAKELQARDINYIVRGQEVIIVDEFTGRTMPGRRWGEGLHQARCPGGMSPAPDARRC